MKTIKSIKTSGFIRVQNFPFLASWPLWVLSASVSFSDPSWRRRRRNRLPSGLSSSPENVHYFLKEHDSLQSRKLFGREAKAESFKEEGPQSRPPTPLPPEPVRAPARAQPVAKSCLALIFFAFLCFCIKRISIVQLFNSCGAWLYKHRLLKLLYTLPAEGVEV